MKNIRIDVERSVYPGIPAFILLKIHKHMYNIITGSVYLNMRLIDSA